MLLLFFNGTTPPGAPVYSIGNGVTCLHGSLFTDELTASVLIGQLSTRAAIDQLSTSAADVTVTKTFTC